MFYLPLSLIHYPDLISRIDTVFIRIFWALGVPLASLWVKYTTGEWIDLMTTDGQLQAAGFSFGYGG